jgi:hypothetical protein
LDSDNRQRRVGRQTDRQTDRHSVLVEVLLDGFAKRVERSSLLFILVLELFHLPDV